jgi:dienelactone hydrolase
MPKMSQHECHSADFRRSSKDLEEELTALMRPHLFEDRRKMSLESKMIKANVNQQRLERTVLIPVNGITLEGGLVIPADSTGIVLFAHGSGSSRHSPRNNFVAQVLQDAGLGTVLLDLLTREEDASYENRFDIDLLTWRLERATQWVMEQPDSESLEIGYFGASTGAAAALQAAATFGESIGAVVSRGGRPDLAMTALPKVEAPTLLIVGGSDHEVLELNRRAYQKLKTEKHLEIVPGATHLFEEPGALQEVARLAGQWFNQHLGRKKVQEAGRNRAPAP